jgi:thiol-disulfide isomerase/thioredoxin
MRRILMLFLAMTGVTAVFAAPFKMDALSVGAKTYHNVTVIGANLTDLYFTHDGGITNLRLKYLPEELQKRFNYDPKAAADAERQQAEDDARFRILIGDTLNAQAQHALETARRAAATSADSLADPVSDRSLLNKTAPALEVEKWLGGKPVTDGKCVLIVFWATWSVPCQRIIPELNAWQKKFNDKLVVIGVSAQSDKEINDLGGPKIEFACALDSKNTLANAVGVTSVPHVLLADAKGVVRFDGHPGALDERKLQRLLSQSAE